MADEDMNDGQIYIGVPSGEQIFAKGIWTDFAVQIP